MSLSSQFIQFFGVAFLFVAFTFIWGWYIGRKQDEDREKSDSEAADIRGES